MDSDSTQGEKAKSRKGLSPSLPARLRSLSSVFKVSGEQSRPRASQCVANKSSRSMDDMSSEKELEEESEDWELPNGDDVKFGLCLDILRDMLLDDGDSEN